MTEQGNKRRKLVGGTYNGDIVSVDDSYAVVIAVDEQVVTSEERTFRVPKRSDFVKALKDSGEEDVCISGLKFENVSQSVVSEFQLDSWDLDLDTSKAYVHIYFGGEIEDMVMRCLVYFKSESGMEDCRKMDGTVGETDDPKYKCLTLTANVADLWVETTNRIRVSLIFRRPIEVLPPMNDVYGNDEEYLPSFETFFLSDELSDIFVSSYKEKWPAHKMVLAHCSEVFKHMVKTEMKETQERNIRLDKFDPRAVKEMLRFIYTGKLESTPEISVEIFKLAHAYAIKGIRRQVLRQIVSTVTVETAPEMYSFGELYDVKVVMDRALSIAKANKGLLVADGEQLKTLIQTHPNFIYQLFLS